LVLLLSFNITSLETTALTKKFKIGIVLLAAGPAERMKQNKLALIINGKTLLENALYAAHKSAADTVSIVVGAFEKEHLKLIEKHPVEAILNTNWKKGIGSSIKYGLQKILTSNPDLDAVIISVCDQPFLTKEVFDGLISTYKTTGKKIIVSAYTKSIGVPVLYDRVLFSELLNIPDRYGGKRTIIEKAKKEMLGSIPFPKGEIDIDTIEDIKKLDAIRKTNTANE